jgi:hypothetical protein
MESLNNENGKFKVMHFNGKKKGFKLEKKELVTRNQLNHIESDAFKLVNFESSYEYANFTYQHIREGEVWDINFELEHILDTLIVEFDGSKYPDYIRIQASLLMDKVIESLRFQHKDKFWSLSHYYIGDVGEYQKRLDKDFPAKQAEHWVKITKMMKIEFMDELDQLFFEAENMHDFQLKVVGQDGKVLCDYLSSMGLIEFKEITDNEFEITLPESSDDLDDINQKIIFAREAAKYGYNIWVDYVD